VSAVTLTVQAAGGYARVEVGVNGGHRLQHVEGVQIERERLSLAGAHAHSELISQDLPLSLARSLELGRVGQPLHPGRHRHGR
jgi:hypothetical protein